MRRPLRFPALLLAGFLAAPPTSAEDFTGFYAGVNAGYAFGRPTRDGRTGNLTLPSARDDDSGLPPSAAGSALATHRSRPGNPAMRSR